jgi:hypothetical protein
LGQRQAGATVGGSGPGRRKEPAMYVVGVVIIGVVLFGLFRVRRGRAGH